MDLNIMANVVLDIQTDEDIISGRQNVLLDVGNKVVAVKPEKI